VKKILIGVLVVAVITGGALLVFRKDSPSTNSSAVESANTSTNTQQTNSSPQNTTESAKTFNAADVAIHNSKSDCWTIINDSVYDITSYVPMHPGGVSEITRICGKDGTGLFTSNPEHDNRADSELARLKIGALN
jgi:cytochrome b involved in lipid metabolism